MHSASDPLREVLNQLGSRSAEVASLVTDTHGSVNPDRQWSHLRCERYWEGQGLFASAHGAVFIGDVISAHLKIALTTHASQALAHELRVLSILNSACLAFTAPRVLAEGCTSAGRTWCLMENVGTRKAVLGLSRFGRVVESVSAAGLPTPSFPVPAALALSALEGDERGVSVHGDLIHSNVLSGGKSRMSLRPSLIDWEWATGSGMRGFDVCHLALGGLLAAEPSVDRKLHMRLLLARAMLRRIGLGDVAPRLLAYLEGMSQFYEWCANQEGKDPASEPVVVNVLRIRKSLAGGTDV